MFTKGSRATSSFRAVGVSASAAAAAQQQHPLSLCADCGASTPTWASINRGVLLCAECCSVHRSLGRHISHVKSLRAGHWIPEQLTMVQSLYSCGSNSIWEYSLLNPGAGSTSATGAGSSKGDRRKPSASDPLHPIKGDFITAKYQHLAFVYRPSTSSKDEPPPSESELSRQLHSSVRTPNLETSLRLLSQGADPNYYHPEKNSTPLQVAARAGQSCQVELLLVYGADPGAVDKAGKSASDYARAAGHSQLATRLTNAQFELSDRLSYFLSGKRPDHAAGQHFVIPEIELDRKTEEARKLAKRKMQMLNNAVFEELAIDVYDEVDRRETDAVWATGEQQRSNSSKSSIVVIPFLPVNPDYGTSRNQGRQKLARLDSKEFSVLVMDVLKEVKRRQSEMNAKWPPLQANSPLRETPRTVKVGQTKSLPVARLLLQSTASDDEPIYDHVASDDDYYHIPDPPSALSGDSPVSAKARSVLGDLSESPSQPQQPQSPQPRPRPHSSSASSASSPLKSSGVSPLQPSEYRELRAQLDNSEAKVQKLIESNDDMRAEISRLSTTVSRLVSENEKLRGSFGAASGPPSAASLIRGDFPSGAIPYADSPAGLSGQLSAPRPSTFERSSVAASGVANYVTLQPQYSALSSRFSLPQRQSAPSGPATESEHFYDNPNGGSFDAFDEDKQLELCPQQSSLRQPASGAPAFVPQQSAAQNEYANPRELLSRDSSISSSLSRRLPSQEEVVRRTEAITRCIQELLISAKDEKFEAFIPCSERIVRAVTDMVILFPDFAEADVDPELDENVEAVSGALAALTAAATHFETECRILIVRANEQQPTATATTNQSFVTQQVIQCAFDIAKATKTLVGLFQ